MQKGKCGQPQIQPCIILGVVYFWFMTGKSSWVPSRTQGFIPCCCRWAMLLRLLQELSVPRRGQWLDHGHGQLLSSLMLLWTDQAYGTVLWTKDLCFKTMLLPLLFQTMVCNNVSNSDVFELCANWMYLVDMYANLLRSWLKLNDLKSFEISGLPGLYELKYL